MNLPDNIAFVLGRKERKATSTMVNMRDKLKGKSRRGGLSTRGPWRIPTPRSQWECISRRKDIEARRTVPSFLS